MAVKQIIAASNQFLTLQVAQNHQKRNLNGPLGGKKQLKLHKELN